MKLLLIFLSLFFLGVSTTRSQVIHGHVYGMTHEHQRHPIAGAAIQVLGTAEVTVTDSVGHFSLLYPRAGRVWLAVSHPDFASDTLEVTDSVVSVVLQRLLLLDEIEVTGRRPSTYISSIHTQKTEILTQDELRLAACCNVSESFESNMTVDVSYSNAVAGLQQIQLLGLAGRYAQILVDALPAVSGLAAPFALAHIPGPWVHEIRLNKGAGSVVNGFESITGQIDVERKIPLQGPPLFVNLFAGSEGRFEANVDWSQRLGTTTSHLLQLHGSALNNAMDHNHDHYMDQPLYKRFQIMDRFLLTIQDRWEAQFSAMYVFDERWGGSMHFHPQRHVPDSNHYGLVMTTQRGEGLAKVGYLSKKRSYESVGLQLVGSFFDQESFFGLRTYSANQRQLYANLIFSSAFGNTMHKYKTGLSMLVDGKQEVWMDQQFERYHNVPGAYFEYTFDNLKNWTWVAGFRADYHNQYGFLFTPRLHGKYRLTPQATARFSVGRGVRTPEPFGDNLSFMASARQFVVPDMLHLEKAWNYGANFCQGFRLFQRDMEWSIDLYRTTFSHQLVIDADTDPALLLLYDLQGSSFSNVIQTDLNLYPIDQINLRFAYRFSDVQLTYNSGLRAVPYVAKHRGLAVVAFETSNKRWLVSYIFQWIGRQRLPDTQSNPSEYQMPAWSPAYVRMLAQVTFSKGGWEVYAGSENLGNFMQQERIIAADDPFGPYFDASFVWGPLSGRHFYAGLRYSFLRSKD